MRGDEKTKNKYTNWEIHIARQWIVNKKRKKNSNSTFKLTCAVYTEREIDRTFSSAIVLIERKGKEKEKKNERRTRKRIEKNLCFARYFLSASNQIHTWIECIVLTVCNVMFVAHHARLQFPRSLRSTNARKRKNTNIKTNNEIEPE